MKSLKQLLSKVKSGKMDKKTAKDLDNLVTRGDGFVVITKSKKDGYNRFHANQVDDRGIDVVPHSRDFKPGKVRGMMRHKPEHLLGDINWKDVKDMYMENTMNEARGTCWVGYKQVGMKKKGDRMVPNCVKEDVEIYYEENGKGYGYTFEFGKGKNHSVLDVAKMFNIDPIFKENKPGEAQETLADYKLAKESNMTMAQLAQAFVNTRPFVTSNIIGATTMEQLKENIDSVNIELSDEILNKIDVIHNNNPNPSP